MPDFVVLRQPGNIPIGIVEAKDIGNQLSRTERTGQIRRYLAHGNLILTNYLEFRWYVNGQKIETVRIARVKNAEITRLSTACADLNDMLRRFARQTTQSVNSAQELAERLARSAQFIAHFIEKDLKSDAPSANLQNQMAAFQKTLLPGPGYRSIRRYVRPNPGLRIIRLAREFPRRSRPNSACAARPRIYRAPILSCATSSITAASTSARD